MCVCVCALAFQLFEKPRDTSPETAWSAGRLWPARLTSRLMLTEGGPHRSSTGKPCKRDRGGGVGSGRRRRWEGWREKQNRRFRSQDSSLSLSPPCLHPCQKQPGAPRSLALSDANRVVRNDVQSRRQSRCSQLLTIAWWMRINVMAVVAMVGGKEQAIDSL